MRFEAAYKSAVWLPGTLRRECLVEVGDERLRRLFHAAGILSKISDRSAALDHVAKTETVDSVARFRTRCRGGDQWKSFGGYGSLLERLGQGSTEIGFDIATIAMFQDWPPKEARKNPAL